MKTILNKLRDKLDMDKDEDAATWDLINEIDKTPLKTLVKEFVDGLGRDLVEIDEQIKFFEKLRLKNLHNKVLRKQATEIVIGLKKEANEIREITRDKAYQRLDS